MTVALERVVIVGASLAGLRAAETLRRQGFDGALTLVGAEPHLPYSRPPLSKQVLAGEWAPERAQLRPATAFEGWDLRLGRRAVRLDLAERAVHLDDGARCPFDGLVIATGAAPRWLPGIGPGPGVHVLRTLDDCAALQDDLRGSPRVAVIGAGFIGAEVAATCRTRGLDVTILEALPVPMVRALGEEMGTATVALHRDHGVDLRTGVAVEGLEGTGRVEAVRLRSGERVPADVVVVGVGVSPETSWLEGSGLDLADGVRCDATLRAAPGVYAAGDVARWPHPLIGREVRIEHWTNANEQGAAVAANLLHPERAEPFGTVPFFWSDQYGVKISFLGTTVGHDEVRVVTGSSDAHRFVAVYGRDGTAAGVLAFDEPRAAMGLRDLLEAGGTLSEAEARLRGSAS